MTDTDTIIEGALRDWRDVLLRLQQMTRNDQGACLMDVRILVVRGQPMYWFTPEKRAVEPAASARAFCDAMSGNGAS